MKVAILLLTVFVFIGRLGIPGYGAKPVELSEELKMELRLDDQERVKTVFTELCGHDPLEGTFDCVKDDNTPFWSIPWFQS